MTNKTQNEEEKDKEELLSEVVENSIDLIDSDTPSSIVDTITDGAESLSEVAENSIDLIDSDTLSSIVDTITDGADLIGEAIGAITSIFN